MAQTGLRLRAHSQEDLPVLSSLCQDMITQRTNMTFEAPAKRFVMLGNRFCWERETASRRWFQPRPGPMRTRSALRFEYVRAVQFKGPFGPADETPLNLLAITQDEADARIFLSLHFSQAAVLRLECEVVEITLDDLTGPWPVKTRPRHD